MRRIGIVRGDFLHQDVRFLAHLRENDLILRRILLQSDKHQGAKRIEARNAAAIERELTLRGNARRNCADVQYPDSRNTPSPAASTLGGAVSSAVKAGA